MNHPTKRLLKILSDGKRHVYNKLPDGIGKETVKLCIEQGFVTTKMVDRKLKNGFISYRTALRITRYGRATLQKAK